MCPVHGAVYAHCDAQGLQLPVLSDARQDGRQPGRHQVGGAEGHHSADVLHRHTVVVHRGQAQVQEDRPRVVQAVLVPEEKKTDCGVISLYKPFGKSASSDITGGRVHLNVSWIDQSISLPSGL